MLRDELLAKIRKYLPPRLTDEECLAYYEENKDRLDLLIADTDDINEIINSTEIDYSDIDNYDGSLMMKDREILRIENSMVTIIESRLLPLYLRGIKNIRFSKVEEWLASRVLPLDRHNAKKILNFLNLPQQDNLKVAIACKGLSLTDSYWYKLKGDTSVWEDVNLYKNHFSDIISEVAFVGSSYPSIQGAYRTPELTGQGSYRKCWVRENDTIYLYKASTENKKESEAEVITSKLLDVMEIPHVEYAFLIYKNQRSCKCKLLTDENLSIIPYAELDMFFSRAGQNSLSYIEKYWTQDYYAMLLVDGIIHNVDRHSFNWGVYMDASGRILGLHPLFDHNCAIYIENNFEEEYSHIIQNKTLLDVGKYAYKKLNKPSNVKVLLEWLESKETKKYFDKMFKDKDVRRQFLIKRVRYILKD